MSAGILGCLTLLAIGWTGLLIPSLIRSIKVSFDQTDAGIGLVYLLYSIFYATGSFGGGPATERVGRRTVLAGAALVHGAGIASLGLAPSWPAFLLATIPAGIGAGALDGGSNGLFLDLYRSGRGRAMNVLHLFFSLGALSAPLVVGALVDAGVPWQPIVVATGVAFVPLVLAYLVVPMPAGRRRVAEAAGLDKTGAAPTRRSLTGPLVLLGIAIACYVAAEVGVSNWLVRFLEPAPLTTATLALSLYWAGIAVGRLVSSAISDRFDHRRFTIACATAMAAAIAAAVLVPSLPASIALFGVAGVASGPVFPMIVALGGERFPERSAAVGGLLTGVAVVGGLIYPPLMGLLSVTIGLTMAMLGNVLLALATAGALVAFGRAASARRR
jgi:fucose permease